MSFLNLVSIIVPVYNTEKYLNRCLKSLVNQSYTNIEIVLVDDGSNDSSSTMCDEWTIKYPSIIRTIHQKNQGASIARKNGIQGARGAYITFVDSDDYVMPNYVSALVESLEYCNAEIAVCPFIKISPQERVRYEKKSIVPNILTREQLLKRFFKYEFWGFWGGMYKKSVFQDIVYPVATINEDYFVKAQMFSKIDYVGYCEQPLYIYEIHPGSLSNLKLSFRALGEFDNTLATWQHMIQQSPDYKNHALSIAAECACKWLGVINKCSDTKYDTYKLRLRYFLKTNLLSIMLNKHLLWKVKVVLFRNLVYSFF